MAEWDFGIFPFVMEGVSLGKTKDMVRLFALLASVDHPDLLVIFILFW